MGKRQIRISGKDCIKRAGEMKGASLMVFLKNGMVFSSIFKQVHGQQLVFLDHHKSVHQFRPEEIVEIILDKVAAF